MKIKLDVYDVKKKKPPDMHPILVVCDETTIPGYYDGGNDMWFVAEGEDHEPWYYDYIPLYWTYYPCIDDIKLPARRSAK